MIDDRGLASLVPNNEVGPPSPQQQAFADTLSDAITATQNGMAVNIGITVTSGSSDVIFGQYATGTIDIADIAGAGAGPGVGAAAILAHEVAEQTAAQTQGLSADAAGHAVAHPVGIAAQQRVSGYTRLGTTNTLRQGTGTIVGRHQRGNDTVSVTFRFVNGNLTRVDRTP